MGKIFISHSSVNNAEALAIDDWLHAQGWADTFLDLDPRRGLVAGERWQAALKSAAESCELILIVISPDWAASRWCIAEFLLAKQMNKQIVGVIVKPTPYETLPPELTVEWQLVDLTQGKMGWTTTISPPRLTDDTTISFSEAGLARLSSGLQKAGLDPSHFAWPPASDPDRAPYRGLLPLDADDAGIFFGRDGMIVLTLDALRGLRAKAAPRFATILGASGAGKSSFLRAGLLPRLERDSIHFRVLPVVRPERAALTGEHGLAAALLAALAARNIRLNRADVRNAVLAGANTVAPLLKQIIAPVDAASATEVPPTLVLAVDQAEELLEPGDSAAEAGQLLAMLGELAKRDDPALIVIFTIRSDGFGRLQDRPELEGTKPHHLVDLSPMPVGSYGDVIRGPARRLVAGGRKLDFEEPLVDALLDDIHRGGGKDALPLLAFTLERLFHDYASDGDLRLAEYEQLGRIRGAIEAAVDAALKSADGNPAIPADRTARLALLRRGLIPWLAGIDPDTKSPRRRVARLSEVPDEARPLVDLMVNQRLLSKDRDGESGETTIEPAHEALLRQWGALDGWLLEDSADLALLEAVRRASGEWAANNKSAEFLAHKGARLGAAEAAAGQEKFARYLSLGDRDYLKAARDAEDASIRAARAARIRLGIAAAIAGIVLVVGGTAGYFNYQAGEAAKRLAEANFYVAQAEAALRAGKPEAGARAALTAYDIMPNTATRSAALAAAMAVSTNALGIVPIEGRIIDSVWLDKDRMVVLATGAVITINAATQKILSTEAIASNSNAAGLVARDGKALIVYPDGALIGIDGSIVAAAPAGDFAGQTGTVSASADGTIVTIRGLAGDVLLRNCRTLPCLDTLLTGPGGASIEALAVKPDGSEIATHWRGGTVSIFADTAAPPVLTLTGSTGPITAMDWSPLDGRIAMSTDSGAVLLLDPASGQLQRLEIGSKAKALAWSPTAPIFAIACDNNAICFYNETGDRMDVLTGHAGTIAAIGWNPDGGRLNSFAPNEPVRLWSAVSDRSILVSHSAGDGAPLTALAIDRERGIIATGTAGTGLLWVWQGDPPPRRYAAFTDRSNLSALAFLNDGRLAAVYENRAIAVWSLDKDEPDKLVKIDNASFSRVAALDGDIKAVVPLTDKRMVTLSGPELRETGIVADVDNLTPWGVVAAPGDNQVFVSYSDGSIRRRDLGAGTEAEPIYDASKSICGANPTTDNNGSKSLDVSSDGKWLVATRTDAQIIVHNLADPSKPICLALPAPDSKTVAFSPDSSRLAILSATDRLYVFDLAEPDSAIILGAPAVPDNSPLAATAGSARTTSWLGWTDNETLAIATNSGAIETIRLDPAAWRARVDSLFFTQ